MRDVVVFAVVFGLLPFAFIRPFYGLMLFSWLAYMRAPDLSWGPARDFRFSMLVAVTMFLGWAMFDNRPFMRRNGRNWIMIAMALAVSMSYVIAPMKAYSVTPKYLEYLKVILIALFTTAQIDSVSRLRQILLVITLSFAFYGVKGGIFGLVASDAQIIRGPGGLLLDNNDFSLAMCMNLPFLFYMARTELNRRMRLFLRVAFVMTIMTIVLTGSRGGFLAMAAVTGLMVLKSRYKSIGIATGVLGAALFFVLIPDDYRDRIFGIATAAKTDASAQGRLHAWGVAWEMIKAKPVFGVGFANFVTEYEKYDPNVQPTTARVAHNSYLQIWAESGSIAFFGFFVLIVTTLLSMRSVARLGRVRDGPPWTYEYATLIEVSMVGFVVGAMFLNRAHFDYFYQLVAIAIAHGVLARRELAKERKTVGRHTGDPELSVSGGDPWLARGTS